jgi:hypothetical protein
MRGSIRKRGSTYTWYISVPDPVTRERRQHSKGGFRTKRECQEALNEALVRLREGTFVRLSLRGLGAFLVDEWLPAVRPPRVRASTWSSYRMAVERHIVPALGGMPPCKGSRRRTSQLSTGGCWTMAPGWPRRAGPKERPEHSRRAPCRPA